MVTNIAVIAYDDIVAHVGERPDPGTEAKAGSGFYQCVGMDHGIRSVIKWVFPMVDGANRFSVESARGWEIVGSFIEDKTRCRVRVHGEI